MRQLSPQNSFWSHIAYTAPNAGLGLIDWQPEFLYYKHEVKWPFSWTKENLISTFYVKTYCSAFSPWNKLTMSSESASDKALPISMLSALSVQHTQTPPASGVRLWASESVLICLSEPCKAHLQGPLTTFFNERLMNVSVEWISYLQMVKSFETLLKSHPEFSVCVGACTCVCVTYN